jgi:hypothetical protein
MDYIIYKNKNKNEKYEMNLLLVSSLQLNSLVAKQFATSSTKFIP